MRLPKTVLLCLGLPCLAAASEGLLTSTDLPEPLSKRALHIVEENARVNLAIDLLQDEAPPKEIGKLLFLRLMQGEWY